MDQLKEKFINITSNISSSSGDDEILPGYEKPNHKAAEQFFHSTLPRRIFDPTSQRTKHRLAKTGELKDKDGNESFLYPLSTSDYDLSEFGIGIGLYFRSVKALSIVLFICACFSLFAMINNANFNPDDTILQLQGSVYGATRADLQFVHQGVSDIISCTVVCVRISFICWLYGT